MAVNGVFTIEDLFGGKSLNHDRYHQVLPSALKHSLLSVKAELTTITTEFILSTEFEKITEQNKLASIIPFTYFYWVLLVLAILLSLILIIFFIYYCHTFVKNYRARRDSVTHHYRYRSVSRHVYAKNLYSQKKPSLALATSTPTRPIIKTETPPLEPPRILPTPVCPSISLKFVDEQLYRRDSEDTSSLPSVRHDVFLREPLSTFMSSASNLSSGSHSQLSSRLSDPPLKIDQSSYESQRASLNLNTDENPDDSLIINIE